MSTEFFLHQNLAIQNQCRTKIEKFMKDQNLLQPPYDPPTLHAMNTSWDNSPKTEKKKQKNIKTVEY